MMNINKFASLAYKTVAYLSFNIQFKRIEVKNNSDLNLLIELSTDTYKIYSDGALMLRKINSKTPMMEYVYLRKGVYNFIQDINVPHRLFLLN